MKSLVIFFLITLSIQSYSQNNTEPASFDCEIIMFTKDIPDGFIQNFVAKADSGTHGGEVHMFSHKDYTIGAISDRTWLGLSWLKNNELISETVTVSSGYQEARVMIMYNPKDREEYLSMNCSAKQN